MSSEQFFFAAIIGLQFFFLGIFSDVEGGGGVRIGSVCVSP